GPAHGGIDLRAGARGDGGRRRAPDPALGVDRGGDRSIRRHHAGRAGRRRGSTRLFREGFRPRLRRRRRRCAHARAQGPRQARRHHAGLIRAAARYSSFGQVGSWITVPTPTPAPTRAPPPTPVLTPTPAPAPTR